MASILKVGLTACTALNESVRESVVSRTSFVGVKFDGEDACACVKPANPGTLVLERFTDGKLTLFCVFWLHVPLVDLRQNGRRMAGSECFAFRING